MVIRSERLKKLENEYKDLEQWLNLGLVPKKDLPKHEEEMAVLREKIDAEKDRLRHLKESGEMEDYVPPKRQPARAYSEPHTLPEMEVAEESMTEAGVDMETETFTTETESGGEGSGEEGMGLDEEIDEEDPFSDRNRWKRGILEDPESDQW